MVGISQNHPLALEGAVLTLKGFRAFRRAWPIYAQGILNHFARYLSEQETTALAQMLGRVASSAAAQKSSLPISPEP
ncbi:MAG: hypothetical protein PVS3B1_29880 [Ktedonobacteraceae bacterium]